MAALELGRRFIGMEVEPTYVAAAERRIAATTRSMLQGDYGGGPEPTTSQSTERSVGRVRSRGSGSDRGAAATSSGEQLGLEDAGSAEPTDTES